MSDVDDVLAVLGELPPIVSTYKGSRCLHRRTTVDRSARRVGCRDCGVDLDPIAVLADLARAGDRFDRARELEREARKRLDDLLREERNAKARAKRRALA